MSVPRFQLIPGGRVARLDGGVGGVAWRLLGPNNRELGRSARAYADAEQAHQSIELIRRAAHAAAASVHHRTDTGLWVWSMHDDRDVLVTSGRGFRHERECRANLEHFREAAPTATLTPGSPPSEFPWQRSAPVISPSQVVT